MAETTHIVGSRVRLKEPVERYPHFIADAGMTGTVTSYDAELIAVRMDEPLPGSEEWDNEIHWYPSNLGDEEWGLFHAAVETL